IPARSELPLLSLLPARMQFQKVAVPFWISRPQAALAGFPLMVQLVAVSTAALTNKSIAPPAPPAELAWIVHSLRVGVPEPRIPPPAEAELSLMVQLVSVTVPSVSIAPPNPPAVLWVRLQFVSVNVPWLRMPPPSLLLPWVIVNPLIVTEPD